MPEVKNEEHMVTMEEVEATSADQPSEEAMEALKKALEILKPIKDEVSQRAQHAIDILAGGAGYGYPEPSKEKYPEPREYPEPLSKETTDKLKEALGILKEFKDEYSDQVKYAIDVLAGAAGYGYPYPSPAYPSPSGEEEGKHQQFSHQALNLALGDPARNSVLVTIIKPGEFNSASGPVRYSEEVLRASIPLWEGAACFCDHFNKSVRNIVGVFYNPYYDEGVKASLRIIDPSLYQFVTQLIHDHENSLPVPDVGISADINVRYAHTDDVMDVTKINRVISADIVFSPAAGGSFDRVLNAAGISLAQEEQNEPEPGSSPPPGEGAESEEELVPVTRVRDLQSTADKLRADLKEKETLTMRLQQDIGEAVSKYRDVLLKANPSIPEELIQGNSIEELDSSVEKAHAVVEKIVSNIEETSRIPAGAPVRAGTDISALSPAEKVAYGLAHPPK